MENFCLNVKSMDYAGGTGAIGDTGNSGPQIILPDRFRMHGIPMTLV